MGAAVQLDITGAKGGESKPKTPVEAPDSLQSTNIAKILLAVGEGEFDGTPTDRDIYLDNTPIMDASGNVNFPGVKWEWRPGSVEQDYIQGIPAVENETTVNVELRSDTPFTRALSNLQLSRFRVRFSWPRLVSQDSSGNTNGYRIEYAIDVSTDGGAFVESLRGAVDGKTTNGYQRSEPVSLPPATSGWTFRVRRITPNANSGTIADQMLIAGYTEIIDQKLRYPNTALLYIEFNAEQFQNIPAVTVDCNAKRWPVPSNYDPVTRTYTGVWDGTFKQAWTNNPVWATYGLCVNDLFGLGKRIQPWMVDKWEMYRISQYCDQLVPDGVGGQEPRYLCDLNLQGKAEAWSLLRDLSAIYRGMVYWAQGSLYMQADMPRAQDIDYVFTRSNVIDGDFDYGGAGRDTHYSRALVSYDNPANNYDTDVIPVTDLALQRRYRDRPIEISAIGCTRASEAQRRGKWALLSNSQDRTVTFKTGMEGANVLPGFVIPVADELVSGRPNGGRISAVAGRVVTLDRDTPVKAGDRLIVNLPNGTAQGRTVQSVNGRAVTVTTAYALQPEPELQWAIDYDDLAVQLFRVLKRVRTAEGEYEFTALEFNPSKFAAIDTGAKLDERPISVIPVTTVQPPASVTLTSAYAVDQGIGVNTMTISWPAVQGAVAYDVEWRKDNGNWVRVQRTGAASVDVVGIYAGAYLARVRAVSSFDITSIWRDSVPTQLKGKEGLPPAVSFLTATPLVYGTRLNWGFPAGAEDTERTEIWQSPTTSREQAIKLGDFAYPQAEHEIHGLAAGVSFFYWARLVDRSGNVGPWYPTDVGVNGQSSSNQSEYEEYFKDKISNGALYPALREEIALISGPPSLPGSVNSRLQELDEQVKEVTDNLQQQIESIADLADSMPYDPDKAYVSGQAVLGADGRLYQAKQAVPADNPPPNTTYWTDIGQAVQTANGLAARVGTVETTVTELNGEVDAHAQQIDGLHTSIGGKADASMVDSLSNRVTQNEQGLSSQGQALTGLQNSLTTTNQNVTAAQQAAQAASDAAGAKGKVLYQSPAPAVADRLAQNLWIDTTGNANTPKRWNGTAWAAVTDKVSTDAAAAAANALSVAQTKADASTVSALSNTVAQQGTAITAQGTALTNIQASIGQQSDNLLQRGSFEDGLTGPWTGNPTVETVTVAGTSAGKAIAFTTNSFGGAGTPIMTAPGQQFDLSADVCREFMTAEQSALFQMQFYDKAAGNLGYLTAFSVPAGGAGFQGYSGRITAPAGAVSARFVTRTQPSDGVGRSLWANMIARRVTAADAANASATSVLDGRVTQTEAGLTAQGAAVTQIQSTIGGIGGTGSNQMPAEYSVYSSLAAPLMIVGTGLTPSMLADSATQGGYALKFTSNDTTIASAVYMHTSNSPGVLGAFPMSYLNGKYIVSFYAKSNVTGRQVRFWLRALNSAASAQNPATATVTVTDTWARYSAVIDLSNAATFSGNRMVFAVQPNFSGVSGTEISFDRIMVEKQIGTSTEPSVYVTGNSADAIRVQATGISQMGTVVEQQGTAITAQASRLDGLYVQVNPEMEGDSTGLAGATGGLVGVWTEQSARIEDGIAMGKRVDTVQSQMGDVSASVQQVSETIAGVDGRVSAMTTIKAETISGGRRVMAGLALGSDGETSEILAYAQRFAIVDESSGQMMLPFVVSNGQVFMNEAFIQDGTITNAKIGSYISSTNYVAGQQGWILNKSGTFEINGTVAGQGRLLINNQRVRIYHANGNLAIDLGVNV